MRRFATVFLMAWIAMGQLFSQSTSCDTAFFSYPDSVFCTGDSVQVPDSVFPVNGFFVGDSGLVVDSLGSIDPGASLPGIYSLTYVVADSCADSFSVSVEIIASANAFFSYSDSLFCVPCLDPLAIVSGDSGGVFSGSGGLVVDSITGSVDIGLSSLGSHYVEYMVGGICPDTTVFLFVLDSTENAAFVFPDNSYCSNSIDPYPVLLGDAGGVYFSGFGLVLDSLSGVIDLDQSNAGSYLVQYATRNNFV